MTQDLCPVCAVSSGEWPRPAPCRREVISLDPMTLEDVAASVELLAARLGVAERGSEVAAEMRDDDREVADATRAAPRRRVFVAEWIDPPFVPGTGCPRWSGAPAASTSSARAGRPSRPTTWDEVLAEEPELVVIAACGFDADEALRRSAGLELAVPAVVVDGDGYFSRPAPRLADGARQLGHLLHPGLVPDPGLPAHRLGPVEAPDRRYTSPSAGL